jgi:hypothetical protein
MKKPWDYRLIIERTEKIRGGRYRVTFTNGISRTTQQYAAWAIGCQDRAWRGTPLYVSFNVKGQIVSAYASENDVSN